MSRFSRVSGLVGCNMVEHNRIPVYLWMILVSSVCVCLCVCVCVCASVVSLGSYSSSYR